MQFVKKRRERGNPVCVSANKHENVLVVQSYPTLCDPMDCSLPGSSVHGILQARMLERVAMPPPGDLPNPGIEPAPPALAGGFFTVSTTWEV